MTRFLASMSVVAARLRPPLSNSMIMDVDEALNELLTVTKRLGDGEVPRYQSTDAFTIGAYDLLIPKIRDGDAFALLTRACAVYPVVAKDKKHLAAFISALASLARASSTTEIPTGMQQIITENPDQTLQLQNWYGVQQ